MPENAAKAVRGRKLRFGSKILPPPGLLIDGQRHWTMYCEVSRTVNFKSVLATRRAIEVGGVLSWGNGFEDHDHPRPRGVCRRSTASRRTFDSDKGPGRSTGTSWWLFGGSHLLNGFLINVHSNALNAMQNIEHYI